MAALHPQALPRRVASLALLGGSSLLALASSAAATEGLCSSPGQCSSSTGVQLLQTKQTVSRSLLAPALQKVARQNAWGCDVVSLGEMRIYKDTSKDCMNVDGTDGEGSVKGAKCFGGDANQDQLWAECLDGSIRNYKSQWCLTRKAETGGRRRRRRRNLRAVVTEPCGVTGGLPDNQRWVLEGAGRFTDIGGIRQTRFRLSSRGDRNQCVKGPDNYQMQPCSSDNSFKFFFRKRGDVVASGKLVNYQQDGGDLCLDVTNGGGRRRRRRRNPGRGDVQMRACEDAADQLWTQYSNGEIVNTASGECLEVSGSSGKGDVVTDPCAHEKDHVWSEAYRWGNYFSLVNSMSSECADTQDSDGAGNVLTRSCRDTNTQKWAWKPTGWLTPVGQWSLVGCHENGPTTYAYTQGTASTEEISQEQTVTVGFEISAGTEFNSVTMSSEISSSLGQAWSTSSSVERAIEVRCDTWPDGTAVEGRNCIWHWSMVMEKPNVNKITWNTMFTRCTSTPEQPKCPPFTACANLECSGCL